MKHIRKCSLSIILAACSIFMLSAPALAGSKFSASVSPGKMSFTVNAQGGITGNRYATVTAKREAVGKTTFCKKIRWVEVVKGSDRSSPTLASLRLDPKRCFFTKSLRFRPFTDDEIRSTCQGAGNTTQRLELSATVFAWKDAYPSLGESKKYSVPKASAPVSFVADVQCRGKARPASPATSSPPVPSHKCDFSGTWYEHNGNKKYYKWRLTAVDSKFNHTWYRVDELTISGETLRSVQGTFYQAGNEDLILFRNWRSAGSKYMDYEERVYKLRGASCDQMNEVERRDTLNGKYGSMGLWIERAKGGAKQTGFNPGRPRTPGKPVVPQQKRPQLPGSGFKPGPNLPPATPHW